jgi:hypothetical protein
MSRGSNRADDAGNEIHVAKAAGSAVPLHYLLDGTPEVDIDEFRCIVLSDKTSCLRHRVRICPVDLDPNRALDSLELGPLQSGPDPAPDRFRRQELR